MADKYPNITLFAYVANNPINAIDPDGKDYILVIDHNARTVTVRATYYTQSGDAISYNSAQQATQFWNGQSGNYTYTVGKGNGALVYAVNFHLQVQQVDNPISEANKDRSEFIDNAEKLTPDKSSNFYQVLPEDSQKFVNNEEGVSTNGVTTGGNVVSVKNSRASSDTGPHEAGHTLGLGHFSSGVLTSASNDPNRTNNINKGYVNGIINNAFKPKNGRAIGQISETGNSPDKYRAGKVR